MAEKSSEGISTGVAVAIGVGGLVLGVIGTAAVYEMMVIPDALEAAGVKPGATPPASK